MSKINMRKHNGVMPKYADEKVESLRDIFQYEEETIDPETKAVTGMILWVYNNLNKLAEVVGFDLYDAVKDDSKIFDKATNRIDILCKTNRFDYAQIECMLDGGDSRHIGEVIQKSAMLPSNSTKLNIYVANSYPEWFDTAIQDSKTPTIAVALTGNRYNGLKFSKVYTNITAEEACEIQDQVNTVEAQNDKASIKNILDRIDLVNQMSRHDNSNFKLSVQEPFCVWLRINKNGVSIQDITDAKKVHQDDAKDIIQLAYNYLENKTDIKQKYEQMNPCIAKSIDINDINNITDIELNQIEETVTDFYNALVKATQIVE